MSSTPTPTMTGSPSASASASASSGILTGYTNYVDNSVGINIPQVVVATIEEAALSNMNMKNSLLMGASVGLSNLVPSYSEGKWGSATEKYIAEPIIAGLLYTLGTNFVTSSGEKERSFLKKFSKGFIVGASSAAVAGALYSSTMADVRAQSIYSAREPGLRSKVNAPTTAPQFIIA